MAYVKYKTKDYAEGQLLAGIGSGAVSCVLNAGQGARFPSLTAGQYFIGTLEKRTGTTVTAKERVLVSARSTDTLTFTRSYSGDTAIAFDANDYFCLHANSDIIIDMQDEITRLETDKLNGAGGLRTALTNRRTYYSNGSGAETALALGSNGTYLKSNGASSAPTWEAPPLDINSQTTETTLDPDADFVPIYDASAGANRKFLAKYIKNLATNAQAGTGTDTVTTINPYQLANYPGTIVAGTTITAGIASSVAGITTGIAVRRSGTIARTGIYTVSFGIHISAASGGSSYVGRIYKNGVAFGTNRTGSQTVETTYTEDLAFTAGDTIEFWAGYAGSGNQTVFDSGLVQYSLSGGGTFSIT